MFKSVFFGSLGVMSVMGFFMFGEDVLVFFWLIVSFLGFLGGKLFLNLSVIFVFVEMIKVLGWMVFL